MPPEHSVRKTLPVERTATLLAPFVFAIGTSIGSFLNVVADRLPQGMSLVRPRSRCDTCQRQLSNIENIPVFSYLWLRGRCRVCGAAIPFRVFAVEVLTGVLFTAVYLRFGYGVQFVVLGAAVSLLVVIAIIDFEHGLILNRVVFPSLLVLLLLAPFWPQFDIPRAFFGDSGMIGSMSNSVVAGAGAFAVFLGIAMAYPQGMGGGDVKLAGLLGLLVGLPGVLFVLWGAAVSGGLVAIALLATGKKGRKDAIPFGPFLSFAGIAVLLGGTDMISGYDRLVSGIGGP